jgi:hypothetical protein
MTLWRGAFLCAMAALAGCGGGADWARPGADEATVTSEYQDCRAMAGTAVRTDADIDQDILATRGAAIVDACMRAKGFARMP